MDPGESYDADDAIELVTKREELVRRLAAGPVHVRDVQAELSVSRSTAYKGIRELEAGNVAERTERGYELTTFGRELLAEYEGFRSRTGALCTAGPLLSCLAPADAVPTDVLAGATVTYPTRHAPNRPVHVVERTVREATRLVGISPVVLPEYVSVFQEGFVSGTLSAELILERPVLEHMIVDYEAAFRASLETGRLTVWETTASLPYTLAVVEEPHERIVVVVHDAGGELRGTIHADSPAAVEWGREVYRTYREGSNRLETGQSGEDDG